MTVKKPRAVAKSTVKKAEGTVTLAVRTKKVKKSLFKSVLFIPRDEYNLCIEGMLAQGLDRTDAITTLRVGIRQANGRAVPAELMSLN